MPTFPGVQEVDLEGKDHYRRASKDRTAHPVLHFHLELVHRPTTSTRSSYLLVRGGGNQAMANQAC